MDKKEKFLSDLVNQKMSDDEVETRFAEIKDRLPEQKPQKTRYYKMALSFAAALILIATAIITPILLRSKEEVKYFNDDLDLITTSQEEFYSEIQNLNITIPDLTAQTIVGYQFYMPKGTKIIVGGLLTYECLNDLNYYFGTIKSFAKNVQIDTTLYSLYNNEIKIGEFTFKYLLTDTNNDIYSYGAYCVTDKGSVVIEYSAVVDEFISFLNQLF